MKVISSESNNLQNVHETVFIIAWTIQYAITLSNLNMFLMIILITLCSHWIIVALRQSTYLIDVLCEIYPFIFPILSKKLFLLLISAFCLYLIHVFILYVQKQTLLFFLYKNNFGCRNTSSLMFS